MSVKKRILEVTIFLLVMFLTDLYYISVGKFLDGNSKCRFKNVSRILGFRRLLLLSFLYAQKDI